MFLIPFFKGILIGLLIAVPTGPVGFLCAKRAITHRPRASIVSAFGSITADLIFGLVAIFGMATVSHFFLNEQNTLRFFGSLLLLYVGIKTFFDMPSTNIPGLEKYEHLGNFASTFSLTMTNPVQVITLPIVFAAIGTNVDPANYNQALVFMLGLAIGSCITWIILIGIMTLLKRYIQVHHFRIVNRTSGVLIMGTGLFVLGGLILRYFT